MSSSPSSQNDNNNQITIPSQHNNSTIDHIYEDFIPESAVSALQAHLDEQIESRTVSVAPQPSPTIQNDKSEPINDVGDPEDEDNISLNFRTDIQKYLAYKPKKMDSVNIGKVVSTLHTAKITPFYPYENEETLEFVKLVEKYPISEEGMDAWLTWLNDKTNLKLPKNIQHLRSQQAQVPEIVCTILILCLLCSLTKRKSGLLHRKLYITLIWNWFYVGS